MPRRKKTKVVESNAEFDRRIDADLNRPKAARYIKSKKRLGGMQMDADEYNDEIDQFMLQKDQIKLNPADDDDEDADADADAINANGQFDLPSNSDSESGSDAGALDSRHAELLAANERDYMVNFGGDGLSDDDEEVRAAELKKEAAISKAWGKKRSAYYSSETAKFEDFEEDLDDALEEEQEVKRLIAEKAAKLSEEDFELTVNDLADMVQADKQSGQQENKKGKKRKLGKSGEASNKGKENDEKLLQELAAEMELGIDGNGTIAAESIKKDFSRLSKSQRLQRLKSEAPELLDIVQFASDLSQSLEERILPAVEAAKEIDTGDQPWNARRIAELMSQLSVNYCINALFALAARSEGKTTQFNSHPAVKHLNGIKQAIEDAQAVFARAEEEIMDAKEDPDDFLIRFKQLQQGQQNDEDLLKFSEDEEDQDQEDEQDEEDEEDDSAIRSAPGSDLFSDINDRFDEYSSAAQRTKPVKGSRAAAVQRSAHESAEDFEDFESTAANRSLVPAKTTGKLERLKAELARALEKEKNAKGKTSKAIEPEDEEDEEEDDEEDLFGDIDAEAAEAFYRSTNQHARVKRQERKEKYTPKPILLPSEDPSEIAEEGKRAINREIATNRGLTRNRRRDIKTPKTRNRMRYEKKIKQRHSQVQEYKGSVAMGYGGEKSGIKTNITKSIKM